MGSDQIEITWPNMDRMFAAMNEVSAQATSIDTYFSDWVCNPSGFDYSACVMKPIGDKLPVLAGWFTDMRGFFHDRWAGVNDAVYNSAREIDLQDGRVDELFSHYVGTKGAGYSPTSSSAPNPVDLAVFDITDVTEDLSEPEEGGEELNHNGAFDTAAELWDDARDTINDGLDLVNGLGVIHIDKIEVGSLRDYVVFPLSANYARIRQNANACGIVDQAMSTWGTNFSKLSANVGVAMQGQASLSLIAHINLYHLAARSIGFGVGAGSTVFEQIATMSEKIAVEVEEVLVLLGKKLLSLSSKVAKKLVPGFGWMLTAAEIIATLGENIRDIWDEVNEVIDLLSAADSLIEEIKAWADVQAARLETFQQVLSAVQELPSIGSMTSLGDLPVDLSGIEKTFEDLSDLVDFGDGTGETTDGLDEALEDLDAEHEDVDDLEEGGDDDGDDGDDDTELMAPGPLGPPYYGGSTDSGTGTVV